MGGVHESVTLPVPAPVVVELTVIVKLASDAVVVPSDTLMTILE